MYIRLLALTTCLFGAFAVHSQNVANVPNPTARTTMLVSEGIYNGCGIRVVGLVLGSELVFPVYGWDFNVTLLRGGQSMASALKTEVSLYQNEAQLRRADGEMKKVSSTWIQVEGATPIKAYKSGIPGENGLSSMTTYEAEALLEPMVAVASGESPIFLLGVQLQSERATRIYRFRPQLAKEDGEAFMQCARTLVNQIQAPPGK
jgi:hypothetical protein